ncbi:hypothetical protein ACO2E2_06915 [Staphylococcus epidermidis]
MKGIIGTIGGNDTLMIFYNI